MLRSKVHPTNGVFSGLATGADRHSTTVARFEAFLEAHPDKTFYLAEICAAIGVEPRTLRNVCHAHFGMSPMRYLRLWRMQLVRRALLQADLPITVTQVVISHGFGELGRFAVNYRALFGETPATTLRRPRTTRGPSKGASVVSQPGGRI